MSRVLLFARDPGGANAVIPLVAPLLARGYEVLLYGKDVALGRYHHAQLDGTDILTVIPEITLDIVRDFLETVSPDVIITGTSADDFTEKFIWKTSEVLGIPSFAIVDQWTNYGLRFSNHGVNDIVQYAKERPKQYLPTRIVAIDEYAREEMIADGLPGERIVVYGQPYFETVLAKRNDASEAERFFASNGIDPVAYVIVFASEPITSTYGKDALSFWGYTEQTILASLITAMERIAQETVRPLVLVVRPHPKEGRGHFNDIVRQCRRVRFCFDTESSPWTLMRQADMVCGMSSMFLIESVILGLPVLSIQIGLCREDPFVLARRGIIQTVTSEEDLARRLFDAIVRGNVTTPSFEIVRNPVARVIAELENLLCLTLQ